LGSLDEKENSRFFFLENFHNDLQNGKVSNNGHYSLLESLPPVRSYGKDGGAHCIIFIMTLFSFFE
jgi:hypothetical protein